MDLGLQGRSALVTGSHRGTGAAIAETLAREGALVWVHALEEGVDLHEVCGRIQRAGGRAQPVVGDIRTDVGAAEVVDGLTAAQARIDVLVNNYGGTTMGRWDALTAEAWHASYDQNVLSAVRMAQYLMPGMRERGYGRIIQLATIGVMRPNSAMPHYYAAKAAMASMSVSLCKELTGSGVTVNTVSPGLIHTQEVEESFRRAALKRGWGDDWPTIERKAVEAFMPNPCQRMAQRQEVADLVAFIASERAGYINGAHLRIDGGATGTLI